MRDLQNGFLTKRPTEQLQADRKFWGCGFRAASGSETAGDADPADASDIRSDGENIGQIHLQRVVRFFTDFERRCGCGGRDDGVHVLERLQKVLANEGADLLRAQVIGVVIAAAQNISTEDDAAFPLGATPSAPRL